MFLAPDNAEGTYQIRGYAADYIKVNEELYYQSIVVMPNQLISPWTPQTLAELKPEHFAVILALQPEIIILGSGQQLQFPADELLLPVYQANIGLEIMNTGAACRTFQVLASEGRAVAAALLIK